MILIGGNQPGGKGEKEEVRGEVGIVIGKRRTRGRDGWMNIEAGIRKPETWGRQTTTKMNEKKERKKERKKD